MEWYKGIRIKGWEVVEERIQLKIDNTACMWPNVGCVVCAGS